MKEAKLIQEAADFLRLGASEQGLSVDYELRWPVVEREIRDSGSYFQTADELSFGARLAWRNSVRCSGRGFWEQLEALDYRATGDANLVFEALLRHLTYATNGGKLLSTISFFAPLETAKAVRVWNRQLCGYAAYQQPDGSIIGDPLNLEFTKICQSLGWSGAGGNFDLLPWLIQIGEDMPLLFDVPQNAVLRVPIVHPEISDFASLGLEWFAVPVISNLLLSLGGIVYQPVFNGFFMALEIARDLGDPNRYNMLPRIMDLMGLSKRPHALGKDQAFVELNRAILHSYRLVGVTIIDHHSLAENFMRFAGQEECAGRALNAEWAWVSPSLSGSLTPVFHRNFSNESVLPNFLPADLTYTDLQRILLSKESFVG